MSTYPESEPAIALWLMERILEREDQTKRNEPVAAHTLDLYAQCLQAVNGDRLTPASAVLH
jgi:hypothetical protein